MAEEKDAKNEKQSPVLLFREKLANKAQLKETVLEGLKSTNAKVRSLAAKSAFKLKDHEVIKKHVLPMLQNEKSKKVLRTVSEKITRKDLVERVQKMMAPKKAPAAKAEEGAAAPAEGAKS